MLKNRKRSGSTHSVKSTPDESVTEEKVEEKKELEKRDSHSQTYKDSDKRGRIRDV